MMPHVSEGAHLILMFAYSIRHFIGIGLSEVQTFSTRLMLKEASYFIHSA